MIGTGKKPLLTSASVSTCSVCGRVAADGGVEDTNGWRWYSDGRGGLHSLCATCPVPTSLPAQYREAQ